eukprot:TRINITY_DN941_c0_g1_i1.p1 TRINITY_DN941_c0_g1~~TRINITY_DN941_c0_g1_i1.p1  ORF type:complete len:719 (-),score=113.03 TRINITY_DN941_c0_g1_i1:310-2466(-)
MEETDETPPSSVDWAGVGTDLSAIPVRPTSAPAKLQFNRGLQKENIFSYRPESYDEFSGCFMDDPRLEDDYAEFYHNHPQQHNLPPPLETLSRDFYQDLLRDSPCATPPTKDSTMAILQNHAMRKDAYADGNSTGKAKGKGKPDKMEMNKQPKPNAKSGQYAGNYGPNFPGVSQPVPVGFNASALPPHMRQKQQHMHSIQQLNEIRNQQHQLNEQMKSLQFQEEQISRSFHPGNVSDDGQLRGGFARTSPAQNNNNSTLSSAAPAWVPPTQRPAPSQQQKPVSNQGFPANTSPTSRGGNAPRTGFDTRNRKAQEPTVAPTLLPKAEPSPADELHSLDDVTGNIFLTAKDQYGCRFLQKILEEQRAADIDRIFAEVYENCAELMTDPFGNYLMQKLLEYCNDEQRTLTIQKVAPELVNISLNMHGTRAVQKLVECLRTPRQVRIVAQAFQYSVVALIKDLNGNHVIQRCLQKLSPEDKQFIYDAVAGRCLEVATHRHGCCVLQRCIDHAGSPQQKMQLVQEVINNALQLVQDPFGNYVVQYVLDMEVDYVNVQILREFLGHVCSLAVNKFSSNVIEKCLRIASNELRQLYIDELTDPTRLPSLLQDGFANYVVQTGLTVANPTQFQQLSEAIKPMLHLIRNTPYGKKIENKLNKRTTNAPNGRRGRGGFGQQVPGNGGRPDGRTWATNQFDPAATTPFDEYWTSPPLEGFYAPPGPTYS